MDTPTNKFCFKPLQVAQKGYYIEKQEQKNLPLGSPGTPHSIQTPSTLSFQITGKPASRVKLAIQGCKCFIQMSTPQPAKEAASDWEFQGRLELLGFLLSVCFQVVENWMDLNGCSERTEGWLRRSSTFLKTKTIRHETYLLACWVSCYMHHQLSDCAGRTTSRTFYKILPRSCPNRNPRFDCQAA